MHTPGVKMKADAAKRMADGYPERREEDLENSFNDRIKNIYIEILNGITLSAHSGDYH